MQIMLKLGEPLWRKVGARRIHLEFDDSQVPVARAIAEFISRYPDAAGDLRQNGTSVRDGLPYHLFLNHTKISWDQIEQVMLHDGDQLALFLIVVGG